MVPESSIVTNLKDLKHDKFYLVTYIRPNTEENQKW